jgi:site-specific recombinase XerD
MTFKYLNIYMPNQVGKSDNYIISMRDTLSLFRDFLRAKTKETEETFTFSMCTRDLVFQFLCFLKNERNNGVSTQNIRLTELKCYLKYASEENISLQSIYLEIKTIPPSRTREIPKEILSPEECYCIFNKTPKTKKGLRDKTFMILLYASACRLSEIINLKISDIYMVPENSYIVVNGKGKKQRIILISDRIVNHIKNYNLAYHNSNCPETDLLFYSETKQIITAINNRTMQYVIKKYSDLARIEMPSIPDRVYSHMFRRSKATTYYNNGVGISVIASILGHQEIETTRRYALISQKMLKDAYNSVETDEQKKEIKQWKGKEDIINKKYGLR